MLRTRLVVGAGLILVALALLVADSYAYPWCPALLLTALAAAGLGGHELVRLLPEPKPRGAWCQAGLAAVLLANWGHHVAGGPPWLWVAGTFAGVLMTLFLVEAWAFREPGGVVVRLSLEFWIVGYLGLLSSFLIQLRFRPDGATALALAVFAPKLCDIGAYFTGRAVGRHRMTPILSPKKTWEGAAGGLLTAALGAMLINHLGQAPLSWPGALAFGFVVGLAGMLGDLMESLVKRDCGAKDASQVVPGFGGVLDVLDAIVFSAPVSYVWLTVAAPAG